ncbi:MAG: OmpA family protein [Nitrospinae bacterium]|nr:OmpA family protein [Nitrospinota bacterium]
MNLFIKSIGVAVLGIGLLGLTSGCAKKMVRGASGSGQGIALATLKASPGGQQSKALGGLSGLDQARMSQEFDLDAGQRGVARDMDLTSATGFPNGSTSQAMLTTPASTSASRFDSPFTTAGLPSSESFEESHGLSNSQVGYDDRDAGALSRRLAPRMGVTFSNGLRDIYFQFDSWRLTDGSRRILEANAEWLKANAHARIEIEGHCDERGTQAYNLVLGEKRASMVQQYLSFLGVPHHQLIVTSFGKDKPKCQVFSETCFQKNRRAHFVSDLNAAVH